MKKGFQYFFCAALVFGCVLSCAKQGSPTGGPVDVEPPKFINASPENFSINFDKKEIRIYFNEYIQLDEPQRQIIFSPPMETKALITPLGTARKYVEIEIKDTLQENTTYTVNFGQGIVDYNEENPLPFFKYVFSTGSYIDSLSVSGTVRDALQKTPDEFISVMLYRVDSTYSDSIVYNQVPTYISYSKDSTNTFQIENIKEGEYKLIAIKDENRNYKFEPEKDEIAFVEETIQVPTDTTFQLTMFKEILDFEAKRPKLIAKQHIVFGYQGIPDSTQIKMLSEKPANFESQFFKDQEKDTLHYFFKPFIEKDSLIFELTNQDYRDTLVVFLRELQMDSLSISASPRGNIGFEETFSLHANTPIISKDTSLISVLDKDSLSIPFSSELEFHENKVQLNFEKEEEQVYQVRLLPGAITDFYGNVNDTLNYRLQTKKLSDFGILSIRIQQIEKFPVIVQLTNLDGEVIQELYSESDPVFEFKHIDPGKYFVRIIFDENKNKDWDTGSYLKKRQPERVIYHPDTLDIRANWDVMETFILE